MLTIYIYSSVEPLPRFVYTNNNEYLERLSRTHVLGKYILSKFNAYNMNVHTHARTHNDSHTHPRTRTHAHTHTNTHTPPIITTVRDRLDIPPEGVCVEETGGGEGGVGSR